MSNEAIIITGEERIEMLRIATIIRGLEFEINHGMPFTRNMPTVKALRGQYGISATTKKQAVKQLRELLAAQEREMGIA